MSTFEIRGCFFSNGVISVGISSCYLLWHITYLNVCKTLDVSVLSLKLYLLTNKLTSYSFHKMTITKSIKQTFQDTPSWSSLWPSCHNKINLYFCGLQYINIKYKITVRKSKRHDQNAMLKTAHIKQNIDSLCLLLSLHKI